MQELKGRVAVVTGGASGIGLALVKKFASEGMKVVLADIDQDALDKVVVDLEGEGVEALAVRTDVSNEADVKALADKTLDRFGGVHVVCNNAGVGGQRGTVWEASQKDFEWVFGVNLWGVVYGVRAFLPIMLGQEEGGNIVNTSSMAGLLPGGFQPGVGIYGMAKHGVIVFSECVHQELKGVEGGDKVGISVLLPAITTTNIWQAERHRPAEFEDPDAPPPAWMTDENVEAMMQFAQNWFGGGQPPELLADLTVDAIREGKFWIIPNERYREPVVTRVQNAFDGATPGVEMPGFMEPGSGW